MTIERDSFFALNSDRPEYFSETATQQQNQTGNGKQNRCRENEPAIDTQNTGNHFFRDVSRIPLKEKSEKGFANKEADCSEKVIANNLQVFL